MLAQRRRRWPSITSALGQCIVLFAASGAGMEGVTRICSSRKTRYNQPMVFQYRASVEDCGSTIKQHWASSSVCAKYKADPVMD